MTTPGNKILTILNGPKEAKKGRQKELNSLREMDVMTTVKQSSAGGKRVTQTRSVDQEKDVYEKSRFVLKNFNRAHGRTQPEMFAPKPSTPSLKTMSAASSHDRNNHPEFDYIAIAAFLHADIDQELFAEPPEESELCEEVGKLHKSGTRISQSTETVAPTCCLVESLHFSPLLTDPSCFRNDDLDIHIFIHVDGLLFDPSIDILR